MTNNLPSSIDLFVDPMDENPVVRPFGKHPAIITVAVVTFFVVLGWIVSLTSIRDWGLSAISFAMVTIPPIVLLTCYNKQNALAWDSNKWEARFMAALRLELGKATTLENRTEFLISVRAGEPVPAIVRTGRFTTVYNVVTHGDEIVMFSDEGIDRDWKSMDASKDYWF